jgi:hypothetical protein
VSYATPDQFAALTAHMYSLDLPDDIGALLQRASADLDSYLSWPMPDLDTVPPAPLDRINVGVLTLWQRDCLVRACCAQAAYRRVVGEDDFVEGKPRLTNFGGLQLATTAPDPIGPSALVCLAGAGLLLNRTGCAPPDEPPAAA